MVVKVAIISTKQGSRAASGIIRRNAEIQTLLPMTTNVLARAKPMALIKVELTANKGHSPSNCAQAGLRCNAAVLKVWATLFTETLKVYGGRGCCGAQRVGGDGCPRLRCLYWRVPMAPCRRFW